MECSRFSAHSLTHLQTIVIHFILLDLSPKVIKERNSRFPDNMNRHCGWRPKVGAILISWATEIHSCYQAGRSEMQPPYSESPREANPSSCFSKGDWKQACSPGLGPRSLILYPWYKEACSSLQSPQEPLGQEIYSVPMKIYLFLGQMTE